LIKCLEGEEFSENGPKLLNYSMSNSFKLRTKHIPKGGGKFSCAPYLQACLIGGQLCPSPYTFLARQNHFNHLSQKSFSQRKVMTLDCRLKTFGLQLFSVYIASPLKKSDKKSLHEITVNSQG